MTWRDYHVCTCCVMDTTDPLIDPVHPARERLERWGYVAGRSPIAERACREVVNLSTDPNQREDDVDRVISLLADQLLLVI